MEHAKSIYPTVMYKIQKTADKFQTEYIELKFAFLPVAHPELNPVELVSSSIKRFVSSNNQDLRLSKVERLAKTKIESISIQDIKYFTSHALKE